MKAAAPELPLKGARRKGDSHSRTEGLTKRKNGRWYLRAYLPGAKRATYRSSHCTELRKAEETVPHLRARLVPGHNLPPFTPELMNQTTLPI